MEFHIDNMWNGKPLTHTPMKVSIEPLKNGTVKVTASGILFNDPPSPPPVSPGCDGATDQLWDYEVVEVFFLNSADDTYLEVELGPYGHHLVLLLQGRRNIIKTMLPMKYQVVSRTDDSWVAEAFIPIEYFPPNIDKLNAYAIHGSGEQRQYQQRYPQRENITQPDFHRLQDFGDVEFSTIIDSNSTRVYSAVWKESMAASSS